LQKYLAFLPLPSAIIKSGCKRRDDARPTSRAKTSNAVILTLSEAEGEGPLYWLFAGNLLGVLRGYFLQSNPFFLMDLGPKYTGAGMQINNARHARPGTSSTHYLSLLFRNL
jgi:hypothetical protein